MKNICAVILICFALCAEIFSQESEFKPEVRVSSTIFTGWEFNADNANFILKLDSSITNSNEAFGYAPVKNQFEISQNTFYLERAYLTVLASLAPDIKGRLTSDVYPITDGTGKTQYQLGIKFAWADWTFIKKPSGFAMDLVIGVIPNNWIPLNDKYFGYRGFAKTLTDYQWTTSAIRSTGASSGIYNVNRTLSSYFAAADLGANITVTAPNGYGELYLNVLSGNGFRNLSFDNRFKDIEAVVMYHPLAGNIKKRTDKMLKQKRTRLSGITDLTLGGFSYLGKLGTGENYTPGSAQTERNRYGGMFHVLYNFSKFGFVKLGGELSVQMNRDASPTKPDSAVYVNAAGYSIYAEFNPPVEQLDNRLMLVARFDGFDPNVSDDPSSQYGFNNNTDRQSLLLLGLAFKPNKVLTLGTSYQQLGYQLPFIVKYDGTTGKSDSRIFFHAVLDF